MMEKILLGSSYLAQAIVMATIAFAVISTIYYLRYNKKIICQPGWDHKIHIFGLHSNRWHGHESIRHHIMVIWRIYSLEYCTICE